MIHFYYTADYELYLAGNHGDAASVLIQPTAPLLDLCDRLAIPLTLFVDVACLWRHREWGEEAFVQGAEAQIRNAVARGHDVQAHLHPHWPHTQRHGTTFQFPNHCYAMGSLLADEEACYQEMVTLLQRTVHYLEGLLQPIQPHYRCRAFRAGGYRLDPNRPLLLKALAAQGFTVDSSIVPGYWQPDGADFRHAPTQAGFWLTPQIFEVPIATCRLNRWQAWRLLWWEACQRGAATLTGRTPQSRGVPWSPTPPAILPAVSPLKRAYWHWRGVMDQRFARLDLATNAPLLLAVVEGFLANAPTRADHHLALLCHPKGLYPQHLHTLENFHHRLTRRYGQEIQYHTFSRLANRLPVPPVTLESCHAGGMP